MNIAIVTNIRSPYRKLQIEEFTKIPGVTFNVYYTNKDIIERNWNVDKINDVNEYILDGVRLFEKYGYINTGLKKIVENNDIILIGGYEQPTYIFLSVLCRLYRKPYVLIYDGISPSKVSLKENLFKFMLKKLVISSAACIFGNGKVSKLYFSKKFGYDESKIFNQFLTIDVEKVLKLSEQKDIYKAELLERYKIDKNKRILLYSGRLIKRKNVDLIIQALSSLENKGEYVLFITGGGEEESYLKQLATDIGISIIITGFISNQDELFKHYFIGDVLILPSYDEPWGLVVNEAMAAGLPVVVSDECGASLDLVRLEENGYVVKAGDIKELAGAIVKVFRQRDKMSYSVKSKEIIKGWTFENSRKSFIKLLEFIKIIR